MADEVTLSVEYSTNGGSSYTPLAQVESAHVSMGITQDTATAEIILDRSVPGDLDAGQRLIVYAGWNGSTSLIFNGLISGSGGRSASKQRRIKCQCYMSRLRHPWGNGFYDYTLQDDDAVIVNLIEKSGIDPSLHDILTSGWTIPYLELRDGTPDPLNGGASAADIPLQLIREIDRARLCWTATRGNGAITRRPIALTTAYASYTDSTMRDLEYEYDLEGIINKVLVKGAAIYGIPSIEEEYSAANSYLVAPNEYNAEQIQTNLLDDITLGQDLATGTVALYNKLREPFTATLDGDPAMQIGYTLNLSSSFFGFSNKKGFIQRLEHSIDSRDFQTSASGLIFLP